MSLGNISNKNPMTDGFQWYKLSSWCRIITYSFSISCLIASLVGKSGTPHLKEKKSSNTKLRCKTNGDYSSNLPIFATEFNENREIWWWMWKDLMKNFHLFYTWVFVFDWLDSVVRRIGKFFSHITAVLCLTKP